MNATRRSYKDKDALVVRTELKKAVWDWNRGPASRGDCDASAGSSRFEN